MNKDNARLYLPLVQALSEGKTIQTQDMYGNWTSLSNPDFTFPPGLYRIKPNTIKIRTALMKGYPPWVITIQTPGEMENVSQSRDFIRWITDWVEVEI